MRQANGVAGGPLCLLLVSALVASTLPAAKLPPGIRWRELAGGGITIIFPAGRGQEAAKALEAARRLRAELAAFWRRDLPGRTRIVLSDSTDNANGFATFTPYNLVGADLAEPPPDSEIASGSDWLDLVLAHELTHLFTLNAGSPLFRLGRRLFGTHPVFFPAVQLPPWAIEGLAVEGESRLTGDGRLNRAPYPLMLAAARRGNRFPGWQTLAGLPAAWPGPNGKYLFGAGFMKFLAEKYGSDSLRRYLERFSGRLLTLGASRDFGKLFGRPLGELWDEYREGGDLQRRPAIEPLTSDGFANRFPCALADGALAYYHRDYRGRGEVRLVEDSGTERVLFKMDAVNALAAGRPGRLLLSASELYRSFRDFSDLYEFDLKKGRLRRLSKGKRLSHPAWSPTPPGESDRIYCVERRNNRSRLALFDPEKGEAHSISMGFAGMAQLSLSPDGARIAAAAKPAGGPWGIAVFLSSGALENFLSLPGNDLSQPRWQRDGQILFIASGKETSHLALCSLEMSSAWRLDEPRLAGTRQFDLSGDGREILFTYYSGRGEEIARASAERIPQSPMVISVATEIPETPAAARPASPPPSRPYRFWRDLLPRWWSPALRQGGDEVQAGAMTGGQDALGIHSYSLEGYYGFSSRRANILFRYVFDGLFPSLSLSYSDKSEYYSNSHDHYRIQELKLASLWPLRIRKRSQLVAYADLHVERVSAINAQRTFTYPGSANGFRLGLDFNSAREYYDSVSPADGVRFTLQGSIHPEGIGNQWASRNIQLDLREYIPLFRPGVLAMRLALARSWDYSNSHYSMGGRVTGSGLGDEQPFKLLRGVSTGSQIGDRGWQFNLEYRMPLLKIEKAVAPSFSLDRVWLAPFVDMGRLVSGHYLREITYSIGGEAVLRLAFGGAVFTDLAFGVAHGFGDMAGLWIYLRMGRSF